jgi:hypothetical protein
VPRLRMSRVIHLLSLHGIDRANFFYTLPLSAVLAYIFNGTTSNTRELGARLFKYIKYFHQNIMGLRKKVMSK